MLESRNMDHTKRNCSWDMFLWKIWGGLYTFMSFSKIFQLYMLESSWIDRMKD